MIDLIKMAAELVRDEGTRLVVYDDATGEPIGPGSHVIGNPTIGTGRCLTSRNGISTAEANYLRDNDINVRLAQLDQRPWFVNMPADRQRAIVNMSFQMGVAGVLSFGDMIAAIQAEDWAKAADAAMASRWATETAARAARVTALLKFGDSPPAMPTGAPEGC
jgi:lysozyme